MTHGLLGFAAFLTVVAATLVSLGIPAAFGLGFAAVIAVQAIELRSVLRPHGGKEPEEELLFEAAD
jgi:hypothetical protein